MRSPVNASIVQIALSWNHKVRNCIIIPLVFSWGEKKTKGKIKQTLKKIDTYSFRIVKQQPTGLQGPEIKASFKLSKEGHFLAWCNEALTIEIGIAGHLCIK